MRTTGHHQRHQTALMLSKSLHGTRTPTLDKRHHHVVITSGVPATPTRSVIHSNSKCLQGLVRAWSFLFSETTTLSLCHIARQRSTWIVWTQTLTSTPATPTWLAQRSARHATKTSEYDLPRTFHTAQKKSFSRRASPTLATWAGARGTRSPPGCALLHALHASAPGGDELHALVSCRMPMWFVKFCL